jgi:isochorismate synthase
MEYHNIESLTERVGFVFNSFNNDINYIIEGLREISIDKFQTFAPTGEPKIITKQKYLTSCTQLIADINNGDFEKVILSRIKRVPLKIAPINIFHKLNLLYKNTFNYIISIENLGCWIGASPETLVNICGKTLKTQSIAGTKVSNETKWNEKEIEEQQFVTEFILNTLKKYSNKVLQNGPYTLQAGSVQHLKTDISCDLQDTRWTTILKSLHPTPATCGLPKKKSQNHINNIEKHQRKFYTGFLGLISKESKNIFVNLRCMEILNGHAYIYIGGGITGKSIPMEEWNETERKSETLLAAIK